MSKSIHELSYYPVGEKRMVRGEGIYLYDEDGREYIDCASATFNLSLGYSHPAVVEAMQKQAETLIHVTSGFQTDPVSDAVRKLVEHSPEGLTQVHLKVSSGSAATRAPSRWPRSPRAAAT